MCPGLALHLNGLLGGEATQSVFQMFLEKGAHTKRLIISQWRKWP